MVADQACFVILSSINHLINQSDAGNRWLPQCYRPRRTIEQTVGVWRGSNLKGVRPVCGSYLECDTFGEDGVVTVVVKGKIDGKKDRNNRWK